MKNFRENKSFGSRGGFSGDKRSGGYEGSRGGFSGGKRPSFGGGRPSYSSGNRSSFGGDRNRQSEVFKASCADCEKSCEVPFRPSGDRPVFCSDCFGSKRGSADETRNSFQTRSVSRDNVKPTVYKPSVDLSEVLAKLDTLIEAVAQLTKATKIIADPIAPESPAPEVTDEEVATKAKKSAKKVVAEKKPSKKVAAKKQ